MSAPRWSRALLRRLSPDGREDEILGDLEEAHRTRVQANGRLVGGLVTALETLDMAFVLLRQRRLAPWMSVLDFKLGARMLMRYPGLTVLGGLAIAFAICAGAATFEFLTQLGRRNCRSRAATAGRTRGEAPRGSACSGHHVCRTRAAAVHRLESDRGRRPHGARAGRARPPTWQGQRRARLLPDAGYPAPRGPRLPPGGRNDRLRGRDRQ